MYYVYVLVGEANNDIYVGSTSNVENRLFMHNSGRVRSTKGYRPWKLVRTFLFNTRSEAFRYEHFLKTGQQKEKLRREFNNKA